MSRLDQEPQVSALAHDLGIRGQGSLLNKIRRYALEQVRQHLSNWPSVIDSLEDLQRVLCNALSLKIEYVHRDEDLTRIAMEYRFSDGQRRSLDREFNDDGTEGWLISHPDRQPGDRRYVAIVDARGSRASRAFFTAWHEVTHMIVTPPQLSFDGFRRAIPVDKKKDPVESVVDAVAASLAFYEPIVRPVLEDQLCLDSVLTPAGIERIRQKIAPEASFQATANALVGLVEKPVVFVRIEPRFKKSQRRPDGSRHRTPGSGDDLPSPPLRVISVVPSASAREAGLGIFPNIRVPERSVLSRAYRSVVDIDLSANEDQSWWETSSDGPLEARPLRVHAIRRGRFVYGLLSTEGLSH